MSDYKTSSMTLPTVTHFRYKMSYDSLPNPQTEACSSPEPSEHDVLEFATIVNFMRSDSDHVVFRRFRKLNLYNLLVLQHQILSLDQQISALESSWDGAALAKILPRLPPLLKAYSRHRSGSFPWTVCL
jgi:hypothetical protein